MTDWRSHARRLADHLRATGDLRSPAWYEAIAGTPRHVLAPRTYPPGLDGSLPAEAVDSSDNLDLVYSTTTLVTAVTTNGYGSVVPISSSTKPDLMIRMLEALDIREGHTVLEIGTGTGYNAALLSARLGDHNVFSIDIDAELVDTARQRLATIGRHPRLAARDGAEGWPTHAPYDRLIATCAVRRIPWAWYEQLAPDGQLLVDYKPRGGNLVLLRRKPDRLEGTFVDHYGAFMLIRNAQVDTAASTRGASRPWLQPLPYDRHRTTTTPTEIPPVVGFLRSLSSATEVSRRYLTADRTGQPNTLLLTAPDGSSCAVAMTESGDGTRQVREGGPTPIWAEVEHAYQQWKDAGEPAWSKLGVTITAKSSTVSLDFPTHTSWQIQFPTE